MSYLSLLQRWGIRTRVLLITVVPLIVVTLLLGYHLIDSRLEDQRQLLLERGNQTAHQLAMASEFWLFSFDQERLESIVTTIASDPNVDWAAIIDAKRQVVAGTHKLSATDIELALSAIGQPQQHLTLFARPIGILGPDVNDYQEENLASLADGEHNQQLLGWAVIQLSLDGSRQRQQEIIFNSLLLILIGLLLTLFVGRYVSKSITLPIQRLTRTVSQLCHGELDARVPTVSSFEIGDLERGFNEMAESLLQAQQDLQRKVDMATEDLQSTVAVLVERNQELDEARQKAQEANQEKAAFLARMSHEIRTPLSAVIGFSRLLDDTDDSRSAKESVRVIKQTAKQLLCVIDDILSFSRLESGGVQLESIAFDLPTCLEDVVAMMSPSAHEKGLELVLHLHGNCPNQIVGDPTRLSQILTNLINNAIKFTTDGHVFIEVSRPNVHEQPQGVKITVSDTGEGLSKEEMGSLFNAFSQADTSITRRFGGSGLGLVISKHLIDLMGGTISLQSNKGQGSSFILEIPFTLVQQENNLFDMPRLVHKKILVYDAHPLSRRALRSTLAGWGVEVFNTGESGKLLSMLSEHIKLSDSYDLLVIGLDPKKFGSESLNDLYLQVRESFKGPILLLIGSEIWQLPSSIGERPNVAWAAKPTRRKVLYQRIAELLGLDEMPAEGEPLEAMAEIKQNFAKQHILSVEDNEFNRTLLRHLLEAMGAMVDEAVSGEEAVSKVNSQAYDLVFMDLHMPGMGGLVASQKIRTQLGASTPPIIALSADVFTKNSAASVNDAFDDYLIKPISSDALEQIASNWSRHGLEHQASGQMADEPLYLALDNEQSKLLDEMPQELQIQLHTEILRLRRELQYRKDLSEWTELREVAHQLCGLVSLYGLAPLKDTAQMLESAAQHRRPDEVNDHLKQLNRLLDRLPNP